MTLLDLKNGERGIILKVRGRGAFRKRIIEMGFIVGKVVEVIKKAPLQDPIEYNILGYFVSLRRSEAALIEVIPESEFESIKSKGFNGILESETRKILKKQEKVINVAIVGNPNSGKTTFFNYATGSRERVGNYSGVTVDAKQAKVRQNGYVFNITDLPGTYSISPYSPEEVYVRDFITNNLPDIVINVVDASNLERNMFLTTQLIDMDIKVVMVLNMYDELQKKGDRFDYDLLGKMIGIPIIPAISSRGKGINEVFNKIVEVFEDQNEVIRHIHINYGETIEKSIKSVQEKLKTTDNQKLTDMVSSRFLAIKLLENDELAIKTISQSCANNEEIIQVAKQEIERIESRFNDTSETVFTDLKYGFIAGALKETFVAGTAKSKRKSEAIDGILTHKLWGFPIFLAIMWFIFSATFILGSYPMEWIETGVEELALILDSLINPGPFKDLLINGVVKGVGSVLVFLPNIMLLFFFISLMEDTGYMSRTVFIMDKIMHKIGLHGKSFIPLLMGFGCNVPAIMATRTLASRNDRLITMLINPFMSCSARLPIYVLFISAFFPNNQGTILFLIYAAGVSAAVITALILKKTIFKAEEIPFVMELPPYRLPTIKTTSIHMWSKAVQYLKKISGIILISSIIIWALGYFPVGMKSEKILNDKKEQIIVEFEEKISQISGANIIEIEQLFLEKEAEIEKAELESLIDRQNNSYIGRIGKTLSPVMSPLGFDWKMTISILSGLAAKEIVVSTLAVLYYSEENVQTSNPNLVENLQQQTYHYGDKKGQKVFTPLVALSFMLFVLLYFPCIGTIAAISREAGHWKWGVFAMVYTTSLAYIVSMLVFQIGSLLGY
ncbi:MAG: ferrous iron transport protein B [Bacteroidetes bacterium]|nr:ferrous iron transport protein B [Bacteroidota bacterium]